MNYEMKYKRTNETDRHLSSSTIAIGSSQTPDVGLVQRKQPVYDVTSFSSPLHHRSARNGNSKMHTDNDKYSSVYHDEYSKASKRNSSTHFRYIFMLMQRNRLVLYTASLVSFALIICIWKSFQRTDVVRCRSSWKGMVSKSLIVCLDASSSVTTNTPSAETYPYTCFDNLSNIRRVKRNRKVKALLSNQTDPSQLYQLLDSSDEADYDVMKHMEMRPPSQEGDCVPMQEWQTKYYPTCNSFHEMFMPDDRIWNATLVGTKGYFRVAWKVERYRPFPSMEAIVLKTLK